MIIDMATICYAWDDADFSWDNANITWVEGCLISEIQGTIGSPRKIIKKMSEDEKKILIGLMVKLEKESGEELTIRSNKVKNQKTKVKIKDMELFIKELREIKVKIIF
jgi:hypothetical protein